MNKPGPHLDSNKERKSVTQSLDMNLKKAQSFDSSYCDAEVCADETHRLSRIYGPIASALASVEAIIRLEISSDTPWVQRLMEHNWIQGGKRIRPVMLLLSGAACGPLNQRHFYGAAAVEMIHAASLLHDDVIDKAEIRRHLPTVNATWGNQTSVLLGDYLFTRAFSVASKTESIEAIRGIAQSSNRVCEGEIRQNAWQGNFELSEVEYMEMIRHKTGELCRCSCWLGALLSDAEPNICEDFGQFGLQIGIAFQIIDDVLDLVGLQGKVGKTLGTDLFNQKPTLPILHYLRVASPSDRKHFLERIRTQPAQTAKIRQMLQETGSLDYAQEIAKTELEKARTFAKGLPPNGATDALGELVGFVLNRSH
jgi:octaprenyl-diphosphate synthase